MTEACIFGSFIVSNDVVIKNVGQTKVATVPVCSIEQIKNGDTTKELVSFFDMELWDKAAEFVSNNVKKGDTFIVLRGVPRQNRWENEEGKQLSKVVFRVQSFKYIPKNRESQ